ncbi:Alpha/beta hydrolase family protein [Maliponia aquimaris]|uniref:Alpha/beta hydrolase family protein n=2 Tax=Maliponia aquimaris TaxID=1673631 RepID=A0A238K8H0_9RHOB|nr:Alpha/beta hydrolase family protein [Maliponia aquimaris]
MRTALALCLSLALTASQLTAEEVTLTRPDAVLRGTWSAPDNPAAAALILPGSGPTDRDGNSAAGLSTDAYRQLAEALAARGIATLRADKRGIGASTGDPNAVTLGLYAQDAGGWIDMARDRTGLPCLWLIGHSEGALVTLKTAQARDDLCGLVLLAPPGRPVSQILLEQLNGVPALDPHMEAAKRAIVSLIAGQTVDPASLPTPLQGLFHPAVQPFLMDLFGFDPAEAAAEVTLPVLLIRGSADLQIAAVDAERLSAALPQVEAIALPGITHALKTAGDDSRDANLATYADPAIPLAAGLAEAVARFLLAPR